MNNSEQPLRNTTEALALSEMVEIPRDNDGEVVFAEPWQAEVFAMTLSLYEQGLFSWPEWAEALSVQIKRAQADGDQDLGDTYYRHWLSTLETMVVRKRIGSREGLDALYQRWDHAAKHTPHGQPISID